MESNLLGWLIFVSNILSLHPVSFVYDIPYIRTPRDHADTHPLPRASEQCAPRRAKWPLIPAPLLPGGPAKRGSATRRRASQFLFPRQKLPYGRSKSLWGNTIILHLYRLFWLLLPPTLKFPLRGAPIHDIQSGLERGQGSCCWGVTEARRGVLNAFKK